MVAVAVVALVLLVLLALEAPLALEALDLLHQLAVLLLLGLVAEAVLQMDLKVVEQELLVDQVAVVQEIVLELVLMAQLILVEEQEEVVLAVDLAVLELLYLAIQLLIDLPLQLQDRPHLLHLAETTYTLLIRLERLLFKEQI